jgi:hypothetical protein
MRLILLATAAILLPTAVAAQEATPASEAPATSAPESATPPQGSAPGQTETTPGQEQTSPGDASDLTPAVTGQTPSGQTTAKGEANAKAEVATTKVTKADVKAGATVSDASGNSVGKIESVTAKGAVLNTGKVKVTVPLSSLAMSGKGLVIGMTKTQIEAAAKKAG